MARVKKATVTVFTATVECPHCSAAVDEPRSGSQTWDIRELAAGAEFDCGNCGERFSIPARVTGANLQD